MPKRKADEDKKTQDVVRPPAPSASNDDEDSDFCDIIEGPIATPGTAVPQGIPPQRSVVASPLVPAARANAQLPFAAAHSHHDPNNAGVLSMLAGFSGAMPYIQPMHAAGFDFRQIPICQQRHSLEYGPPDILASQAPFQGRRYPPGPSLPRPVASPVASSSNGMSSGASSPAPACLQHLHASSSAQEVKEEPDDTALRPTEAEVPLLASLRAHGVPTHDAIQSLRRKGLNFTAALKYALEMMTARNESRQEDMARLESEKEKDRVADERRLEEKTLTVLGDIQPQFQESLLLNEEEGCAAFRETVQRVCSGDEICTPALCAFREKAVNLLFLERDAFRHYRENHSQVRRYFRELIERLPNSVANWKTEASNAVGGGEASDGISAGKNLTVTESASTLDFAERGQESDCGRKDNHAVSDAETDGLTARVTKEVEALQQILYMFPSTPGGVPDAFLEQSQHAATLTADGVEELLHPSSAADRSARSEDRVVITVDD